MSISHQDHKGVPHDLLRGGRSSDQNSTMRPGGESRGGFFSGAKRHRSSLGVLRLERTQLREIEDQKYQLHLVLLEECKERLAKLNDGYAVIAAVRPVMEDWFERHNGILS